MAHDTLAFIGGGNMAQALVQGAIASGDPSLAAGRLMVVEPDAARRAWFEQRRVGVLEHARDLAGRLTPGSQLVLAVKPQSLRSAAADLAGIDLDRVVISILAGTASLRVREALGGLPRVVRAMPNTPARVAQGATALALGDTARPGDEALAERLFKGVGPLVVRIDESLMDAFTAVAASGPAYLLYLAQAMSEAAVKLGFAPETADRIVRQTLAGSAELLRQSSESPEELRARVTSKGGTTEAAIRVLDAAGQLDAVVRAITAARDRGRELDRLS